jgi:hypothetical protein
MTHHNQTKVLITWFLTMYVLEYKDDLIIISSSKSATTHLLQQLDTEFSIKDCGTLHYFLGIDVSTSASGLILSWKKYISDLLHKTHMIDCRPVSTPLSNSVKISQHDGTPLSSSEATIFWSTVGTLQYLKMARPDLDIAVNKVC